MATPAPSQPFSSLAGGITDISTQTQTSTLADSESATTPPTAVPDAGDNVAVAPKRRGRPKGSKNRTSIGLDLNGAPEKRPVGRPRGSGKKKTESDASNSPTQPKRPVGRPRKDGLPSGSTSKLAAYSTLVPPPTSDKFHSAPIHQWVPASAYPTSVSAPAPSTVVPSIDPALQGSEWAELLNANPDNFLPALLAALEPPNSPSVGSPSLEDIFKSHLVSLTSPATTTIPSLYSILKTFWLPSSPSYFALTASASSSRTPTPDRFLYWDPQPLVFNGIACPVCSYPLINRGRIRSGPLTIHDLAGPFFIIGCQYACPAGHAFASTDASVRRALPPALEREFPARLVAGDAGVGPDVWNWGARGVSRTLWNLVVGGVRAGLAREVILQLVRGVQHGVSDGAGAEEGAQAVAQTAAPMEEEEEEEGNDADGDAPEEGDSGEGAVGAPSQPATAVGTPPVAVAVPATQLPAPAFNDAWTANTIGGTPGVGVGLGGIGSVLPLELRNNPYARLTMPGGTIFHPVPTIIPYDPTGNTRKRPYPFIEPDPRLNPNATAGSSSSSATTTTTTTGGVTVAPKPRNPRHCCKCGLQTCKGKGGRHFCMNACMDCGKMECRGRNSRRPDKKCDEAGWPVGETPAPAPAPAPVEEAAPDATAQVQDVPAPVG